MMNFVVGACVVAVAGLAIRALWKDHKGGKSCGGCSGDCAHCHRHEM